LDWCGQTLTDLPAHKFISKAMDKWAYERSVELDFSRPGKPTDKAKIESFNGRLRQECLNMHWFLSLDDGRTKIEGWRQYYNATRPTPHCSGKARRNSLGKPWERPLRRQNRRQKFPVNVGTNSDTVSSRTPHRFRYATLFLRLNF
jgi:hypothetical protein